MVGEREAGGNGHGGSPRAILQSDSGLDLASDFWMHRHFRAMAALYNSLLNEANLLPGDRVLDLGCGSGTHFEWIAKMVGPEGKITGLESDQRNLGRARERIANAQYREQVDLVEGKLTAPLPFDDNSFDIVWCAGSLQYVPTPVETIREMMRVVRPGGRVAVQDVEMTSMLLGPMPDELLMALKSSLPRGFTSGDEHHDYVDWLVGHKLRSFFVKAGLREIRGLLRTRVYEPPFTEDERGFLEVAVPYLCTESPGIQDLAYRQVVELQRLVDPESPAFLLDQPDFIFVEGRALAVGIC
ncbi:MAG: methyltransferase domain-containing protein [Thermomicrobiales bacterium]